MHLFKTLAALSLTCLASSSPLSLAVPGRVPNTTSHFREVRGHTYHYLLAEPQGEPKGTILLLHGFPDLSYTWRFQIPAWTALGYRIIAPNLLGYAGTDSPSDVAHWARKEMASDMVNLAGQISPGEQIVVGGHDWGAGLAYKVAQWYPEAVKGFFTLSVPYMPKWLGPLPDWQPLSELVADGTFPSFGYQLQWLDPSIDRNISTASEVRSFINAAYGGVTPDGAYPFTGDSGLLWDILPTVGLNPLMTEDEADFYVDSFLQNGIRGIFNWYRTRRMDWEDELPLITETGFKFSPPSLFVAASQDVVIPPSYWEGVEGYFDDLEIQEVNGTHWIHWERAEEINEIVGNWIVSLG